MRLRDSELAAIIAAVSEFIPDGKGGELFLFGSRVNDDAKGGDIDLLLLSDDRGFVQAISMSKHRLLASLYERLGEQKIDFKVAHRQDAQSDPFLSTVLPGAKLLKRWAYSSAH